jgi:hypothetical protein
LTAISILKRYQDQKWIIYDLRRKYGVYYDLNEVEIITMDLDLKSLDDKANQVFSDTEIDYKIVVGIF